MGVQKQNCRDEGAILTTASRVKDDFRQSLNPVASYRHNALLYLEQGTGDGFAAPSLVCELQLPLR